MKKYYFFFKEGSKINQVLCAILINLPVFSYGAAIGWMSPMTLLLQSENSPRAVPLTDAEVSLMGSVPYGTCIIADFLVAWLSSIIGKKITLLLVSACCAITWIIKLSSYEVWALVLARSFVGIMMAGAYVICPVYTKEISEDSIRGVLCSLVVLFHTTGNLFLYIVGDILSYRNVLWICLAMPTIHLVLFMMMPDSPSYLMKTGKIKEATRVLAWLRCRDENDAKIINEINIIKKELENDEANSNSAGLVKSMIKDKILFRALRIAIIICIAREVCGAIPVMNFAGDIFSKASENSNIIFSPNQQAMMLGAVQVAGSTLASGVVEKAGRKLLICLSSLVSGLSMCCLASWFLAKDYEVFAPAWLPIVTLCICIFCDSCGLQPMSVVVVSEMFSYKYRGAVMATTMAIASAVAFIQMLFFKPLASFIGVYVSFYFFGVVCLANVIYCLIVVPETKMRGLEDIYEKLKTKKEKMQEFDSAKEIQ